MLGIGTGHWSRLTVAAAPALAAAKATTPTSIDVSQRLNNESEAAVAINSVNPKNNSNSARPNPDGALHQLDIHTSGVVAP